MRKILVGIILLMSTSYVVASDKALDQTGWIVGGGAGPVKLIVDPKNQPLLNSTKENTSLYTAFGGYNFSRWFGIEFDLSLSAEFTDENTGLDASILGSSFTPKFTYHFNNDFDVYLKGGLQYISYEQAVGTYYNYYISWNGIDPVIGAGLQYSFPAGVRARLDYKYSSINLERSENSWYGYNYYDEGIDLIFKTITLTVNYQF